MRRLTAIAFVTLAACSGGGDGDDTPPQTSGIALDALCAELAEADCDRAQACDLLAGTFDHDACVRRQQANWCTPTVAAIDAAVDDGVVTYFELAARECRQAITARSCAFGFDYDLLALPECRAMLEAAGTEGDACPFDAACADGFWCDASAACPGTCRPFLSNNANCTFGDRCADGLFCGVTSQRCLAQVALDSVCELSISGNSCRPGGFCDTSSPGEPVCRPVRGRGEGCQSDFECLIGATCIRNRCSAGEDGDNCQDGADCDFGLVCGGMQCTAPREADAPCSAAVPCRVGYRCIEGSCTAEKLAGEACIGDDECLLGRCEDDLCVEAFDDGVTCTMSRECLPERTCEDVCTAIPLACG